ncbi:MAG: FABP family protein [Actinobacteria bacterium]|jgi:THAP4-like, heme-binding beta-barrel domain|nr:FABP family protein [Actinomycetota bacterium]
MVFQIPEGLHPDLNPLAWLVGTWIGKGRGEYETIQPFEFAHEVVFAHDGRPFLTYYSRSWILDADGEIVRPGGSETGFWRVKPDNVLEVVISHNTGISEGWVGRFDGPKIQLEMDQGYSAPSAKIVTAGSRLYGLVEGELFFAYDMAAEGRIMQPHLWSTLPRVS